MCLVSTVGFRTSLVGYGAERVPLKYDTQLTLTSPNAQHKKQNSFYLAAPDGIARTWRLRRQ